MAPVSQTISMVDAPNIARSSHSTKYRELPDPASFSDPVEKWWATATRAAMLLRVEVEWLRQIERRDKAYPHQRAARLWDRYKALSLRIRRTSPEWIPEPPALPNQASRYPLVEILQWLETVSAGEWRVEPTEDANAEAEVGPARAKRMHRPVTDERRADESRRIQECIDANPGADLKRDQIARLTGIGPGDVSRSDAWRHYAPTKRQAREVRYCHTGSDPQARLSAEEHLDLDPETCREIASVLTAGGMDKNVAQRLVVHDPDEAMRQARSAGWQRPRQISSIVEKPRQTSSEPI